MLVCARKNVIYPAGMVYRRLGERRLGDIRGTFGRKLRTFGRQHLYDILWDFREKTIGPLVIKKSQNIIWDAAAEVIY